MSPISGSRRSNVNKKVHIPYIDKKNKNVEEKPENQVSFSKGICLMKNPLQKRGFELAQCVRVGFFRNGWIFFCDNKISTWMIE